MAEDGPTTALAQPEERGSLTIADKVVEKVASIAAREIEHVTDTRAGWTQMNRSLPKASAKIAGGRARIGVEVAASWPASLPAVTAQVRDHVNNQVTQLTGVTVVAVDVTIADVVHLETNARRVR